MTVDEDIDNVLQQLQSRDYIYATWAGYFPVHQFPTFYNNMNTKKIKRVSMGGWPCHSPHYNKTLENFSIDNIYLALLERDDILLMASKKHIAILITFIQENYKINSIVEPVFSIDDNMTLYNLRGNILREIAELPPLTKNVTYFIDEIGYNEHDQPTEVIGWACIQREDASNNIISLLLKSAKGYYLIDVFGIYRPDVTEYYQNAFNYDQSGFKAVIPLELLPPETYTIGILIKGDDCNGLAWLKHNFLVEK